MNDEEYEQYLAELRRDCQEAIRRIAEQAIDEREDECNEAECVPERPGYVAMTKANLIRYIKGRMACKHDG